AMAAAPAPTMASEPAMMLVSRSQRAMNRAHQPSQNRTLRRRRRRARSTAIDRLLSRWPRRRTETRRARRPSGWPERDRLDAGGTERHVVPAHTRVDDPIRRVPHADLDAVIGATDPRQRGRPQVEVHETAGRRKIAASGVFDLEDR